MHLTTELTMLAYASALLIVLVFVQANAGIRSKGLMPLANHRDGLAPAEGFHARCLRIVDNHREGMTMFAPVVLAAGLAGIHNSWTVLGAELFFWSRLAHAVLYLAGVPVIRPLAWGVGLAGTIMVLLALLGLIH